MTRLIRSKTQFNNALKNSINGFIRVWQGEVAFREYSVYAIILIIAAHWLGHSNVERAIMIFSVLLVLLTEMLNTAIETVVDRISDEQHELSGAAKDIGSAAVVMSIAMFVVTWLMVLI